MRIVLIGGGGHASDVLGAFEAAEDALGLARPGQIAGLVADDEIDMRRFKDRGVAQIGSIDDLKSLDVSHFVSCVGYPKGRKAVAERAMAVGLVPAFIIHPQAWVPPGTPVGAGAVILAGACISPGVIIGAHAYISHGALIGHDATFSDYATLMPGASVSGDTALGEGAMIGSRAVVLERLSVGAWATVGAGAVVTRSVPADVTVKGVPARS